MHTPAFLRFRLPALLLCSSLLAACSGNGQPSTPAVKQDGHSAGSPAATGSQPLEALPSSLLPPLDSLPPLGEVPRSGSYVEADLLHKAAEYDAGLPFRYISPGVGTQLVFSPLNSQDPQNSEAAYAIYRFSVPDYDRAPVFKISLADPDPLPQYWLGLANWDSGRWDFRAPEDATVFPLDDLAPYFDGNGMLLAALVVWGPGELTLNSMHLGPFAPGAIISADVTEGDAPLAVSFDAGNSVAVEGSELEFSWDLDADGVFETDSGNDSQVQHTYTKNGVYQPAVRVTNQAGISAVASLELTVIGQWYHTWGRTDIDEFSDVLGAADGSVYACGVSKQPGIGGDYDALLCHWSAGGLLLWARRFDTGSDDLYHSIAQDGEGRIVLCGQTGNGTDADVLVHRLEPDGSLIWGRRIGGAKYERADRLVVDGTDIYIAGNTDSPGASTDTFVTRLDGSGSILWQVARDNGGATDILADMAGSPNLLGNVSSLVLVCKSVSAGVPNCWKLVYGSTGSFSGGQLMQQAQYAKSDFSLVHKRNALTNEVHNYIAGHIVYEGNPRLFLSDTDGSGNSLGFNFYAGVPDTVNAMIGGADGNLLLAASGNSDGDGLLDTCFYYFSPQLEHIESICMTNISGGVRGEALTGFRQGFLLGGYAPDIKYGIGLPALAPISIPIAFEDADGSNVTIDWTPGALIGDFEEIGADGTLDSGAGGNDGLLMYLIP